MKEQNNQIKVSVVTTIYNCKQYLRESIQSILDQSFRNFELIIINDGSTDSPESVVFSFKDPRIRYIRNPDNKKIPTRRNEAIKMALGKFIAIHDGDDISDKDRLAIQYQFLENNADYFCIGGHAKKIDLTGKEFGVMDYPPETHAAIDEMIVKKCMNPMIDPTTMFRKADFDELGGYTTDPNIYTVPDFDLWLRAISSGRRFVNMQEPLIRYRVNPNGMTGKHKEEMIRSHMVVWRKFMENRIKSGPSIK
jgi:glycosyltransferase involved in cell wall biosynthesis